MAVAFPLAFVVPFESISMLIDAALSQSLRGTWACLGLEVSGQLAVNWSAERTF
jgi:hypothetical protein